jgi:MoaA/NifB/PqqE/SkfB family radical SAM enzyme
MKSQFISKVLFYSRAFLNMHVFRKQRLSYMPEYIAIEVTNVCNFKCAFCPQIDPKHHELVPKSYLKLDDCELFLRKIRDAGITTDLMHWTLDGEPFMNDQFSELVGLSAKYGFTNTYFASNGMLCSVERLLDFPLDRVRLNIAIDFCANKEYFENVRGTKRSWDRVRANIESILADPRTQNVGLELTDISSYSESDPDRLRESFMALQLLFGVHKNINFRTRTFHNATGFLSRKPKNTNSKYHICPYPWTHFRIASNGEVVICCRDLQHKTVLGNLKSQSVAEIWNGIPMLTARRGLLEENPGQIGACRGCDLPYDDSKFTFQNLYRAARGRMQLFAK